MAKAKKKVAKPTITSKTVRIGVSRDEHTEVMDSITDMQGLKSPGNRALNRVRKITAKLARRALNEKCSMKCVSEPALTVNVEKRTTKLSFIINNSKGARKINLDLVFFAKGK